MLIKSTHLVTVVTTSHIIHDNDFLVERVHDGDLIGDYFVTSINNSKKKKKNFKKTTSGGPPTANHHPRDWRSTKFFLNKNMECHLVTDHSTLQRVVKEDPTLQGNTMGDRQFVALDCEGVGPKDLCLLQVATKKSVYIFDSKTLRPRTVCKELTPLLTSNTTIKLIHDLGEDARAIQRHGKVLLAGALDTQLASKHIWKDAQQIGFNGLLERLNLPTHPSKDLGNRKKMGWRDTINCVPRWWMERPIPHQYLEYAAWDVNLLHVALFPLLDILSTAEIDLLIDQSNQKAAMHSEKVLQEQQ